MSNENFVDRLFSGIDVAIGNKEAIPAKDLNDLKQKAARPDALITHEARLKWMEAPFLILQLKADESKSVLGRFINPEIHSSFCPAVKIEVKSKKLIGKIIPLEFLISSDSLPKVLSFSAKHKMQEGPNIIMPKVALKTEGLAVDKYTVSLAIPAGLIINSLDFSIDKSPEHNFSDVLEPGMSVQDFIDLIEEWKQ